MGISTTPMKRIRWSRERIISLLPGPASFLAASVSLEA